MPRRLGENSDHFTQMEEKSKRHVRSVLTSQRGVCALAFEHTLRLRLNGFRPPFRDRFAAVSDRFRGLGAGFWNLGGQTEKTAKKREKTGKKWARNGLKKVGPMTD